MVDLVLVQRRLALLRDYAERLATLGELGAADYSPRRFEGRYLVQVCAQICIDLANHVIASEGWPAARDQRDAVARLMEHGVVSAALGERMQALMGLRNRLFHLYDDIDDEKVRAALRDGLRDFEHFGTAIAAFSLEA